jgi:protein involved in polysaccharide export with SLBB domain
MTILDILAESGGPTQSAYLEKIMVVNISQSKSEENVSRVFDLESFIEHPDFTKLPLVRLGDTIFVPDVSQSNWNVFMANVKDMLSVVSLVAIVGGL